MMRYSSTFRTASRIFVCGVVSILSWTTSPPLALGLAFTNDPLVPGLTITTADVTELRTTVDTIRQPWNKWRSEEHTSELQSRLHLVCRLLLEKKKNNLYRNSCQRQPP